MSKISCVQIWHESFFQKNSEKLVNFWTAVSGFSFATKSKVLTSSGSQILWFQNTERKLGTKIRKPKEESINGTILTWSLMEDFDYNFSTVASFLRLDSKNISMLIYMLYKPYLKPGSKVFLNFKTGLEKSEHKVGENLVLRYFQLVSGKYFFQIFPNFGLSDVIYQNTGVEHSIQEQ